MLTASWHPLSFLHPTLLLAGLASVAIPILIHLLMRRRRKPMPWAAMRFVQEAFKKLRRRLLIQQWLLLAARCLLVVLVALAVGRPVWDASTIGGAGRRLVVVLIDDSLTDAAAAEPDGPPVLARSAKSAAELVRSLREGDRVAVITLAAPAAGLISPPSSDLAAVASAIEGLTSKDSRADIASGLALAGAVIAEQRAKSSADPSGPASTVAGSERVVLYSGLRAGSLWPDTRVGKLPGPVTVELASPAGTMSNTALASINLRRGLVLRQDHAAGRTATVRLTRSGDRAGEQNVTVRLLGTISSGGENAAASFEVPVPVRFEAGAAEAWTSVTLPTLTSGGSDGRSGDGAGAGLFTVAGQIPGDALVRDNRSVAAATTAERIRLVIVADDRSGTDSTVLGPSRWFELASAPGSDSPVVATIVDPSVVDSAQLAGCDAVVVTAPQRLGEAGVSALSRLLDRGGLVLITPPADAAVHTWADALLPGLGLSARIAREAVTTPDRLDATFTPSPAAAELLGSLRNELADLLPAVGVLRLLPVERSDGGGALEPLIVTSSGKPLLTLLPDATAKVVEQAGAVRAAEKGDGGVAGGVGGVGGKKVTPPGAGAVPVAAERSAGQRGAALYLASAADSSWTDLPAKPLFVPLIQELLRQGAGRGRRPVVQVAGQPVALSGEATRLVRLASADSRGAVGAELNSGPTSISVGADGRPTEPIRNAGLYSIIGQSGLATGTLVIEPDTAASNTEAGDRQVVERWLGPATDTPIRWMDGQGAAEAASGGTVASKATGGNDTIAWIFGLALIVALIELLLAHRADHSSRAVRYVPPTLGGSIPAGDETRQEGNHA